jgi:hypothetical protein
MRGDVELAKIAIRGLKPPSHNAQYRLTSGSLSNFDDIPPRYIYALMRATFAGPSDADPKDPELIADQFTLY